MEWTPSTVELFIRDNREHNPWSKLLTHVGPNENAQCFEAVCTLLDAKRSALKNSENNPPKKRRLTSSDEPQAATLHSKPASPTKPVSPLKPHSAHKHTSPHKSTSSPKPVSPLKQVAARKAAAGELGSALSLGTSTAGLSVACRRRSVSRFVFVEVQTEWLDLTQIVWRLCRLITLTCDFCKTDFEEFSSLQSRLKIDNFTHSQSNIISRLLVRAILIPNEKSKDLPELPSILKLLSSISQQLADITETDETISVCVPGVSVSLATVDGFVEEEEIFGSARELERGFWRDLRLREELFNILKNFVQFYDDCIKTRKMRIEHFKNMAKVDFTQASPNKRKLLIKATNVQIACKSMFGFPDIPGVN